MVLLAALGSPLGLGVQPLSWLELTALWDVPILVSDSMSGNNDNLIIQAFVPLPWQRYSLQVWMLF
jgi:hypothetical protein